MSTVQTLFHAESDVKDFEYQVTTATEADTPAIAELRTAVAEHLTGQFGKGHWSSGVTEESVLRIIRTSRVLVASVM